MDSNQLKLEKSQKTASALSMELETLEADFEESKNEAKNTLEKLKTEYEAKIEELQGKKKILAEVMKLLYEADKKLVSLEYVPMEVDFMDLRS